MKTSLEHRLKTLSDQLDGRLEWDALTRVIYATDASVYRKIPLATAFPKNVLDLQKLIAFAAENQVGLIPRAAGTSLAGQCVGEGLVVDVSKHLTAVLDIDPIARTATVGPGVVRDELNRQLAVHGLFFGPNTSTANRCTIGGMVGNNASGTTSIQYGVTRDKVLEMETVLADGSTVVFGELSKEAFFEKCAQKTLEGRLYNRLWELLKDPATQARIRAQFPKPNIHRRNTGYAVDALLHSEIFTPGGPPFNFCKLLVGSEGTLAFTTRLTLRLDPLPPPHTRLVAAHFHSIADCLQAVVPAMRHNLHSCEMMDKVILDCTQENLLYKQNRLFIEGDPKAILLLEIKAETEAAAERQTKALTDELSKQTNSYSLPVLQGDAIEKALELRKAGLGLLGNMTGDPKAVACIEDTAVAIEDLADYIGEFSALMERHGQQAVYYAHAGAGELHLRPILNLKKQTAVDLFKQITAEVAQLVKKYNGSLSGEHGDGIVRSGFIPMMIGAENYTLLKKIKQAFDPQNIFNPGKITDPLPMDQNLRYRPDREEPHIETLMDFGDAQGILRLAEKCNGSGDCRKGPEAGGSMCPSYRATRDEKDTTRARANALREFLTNPTESNPFDHRELKDVFALCLSCKGCKSECPSNVDVAALKAEWQYQYQQANGYTLRNRFFVFSHLFHRFLQKTYPVGSLLFENKLSEKIIKKIAGIAPQRSLPKVSGRRLTVPKVVERKNCRRVYLFVDEFTELLDTGVGQDALQLLTALGYDALPVKHRPSGRAALSKGFLKQAKRCADQNVNYFSDIVSRESPLIGIEPSAVLSFRDEYLRLATDGEKAKKLSEKVFLIDEFLAAEIRSGHITPAQFRTDAKNIKLHGHCHQKALSSIKNSFDLLNLPENYRVTIIPSGCCGMAGSFGYEKEHYDLSLQIGEQTLFPAVRKADSNTLIAAPGSSCRHQIADGTGREALHPVSILRQALLTTP